MSSLNKSLKILLFLLACFLSSFSLAEAQVPNSYVLMTNSAVSSRIVFPQGGVYSYALSGTFGGASVSLQEVFNGKTYTLETDTTAPSSTSQYCVPQGAAIQAVVSGGTGVSLYATLGGTGPGSCFTSSASTTTNQGTAGTSPWVFNETQQASVTLGAPSAWGVQPTGNVQGVNADILGTVSASDPNNASFSTTFSMAVGTTYSAIRMLQVDCPNVGSAVVLTLASGTETLNVVASAQSQFFPFAATQVVSTTGTCTFTGLR